MPVTTPRLGLPKSQPADNARDYATGSVSGGGLWRALEILDNAILEGSVNDLDDVTLTSPNIGADQWTDANHTHASAATAGSTLGPGTTLSTPTLQTPAVSGVMTFGGDATLSRTGAGALRADTHLGVGVNPAAWHLNRRGLQVADTVALNGNVAGLGARLADNTFLNTSAQQTAIATGPAVMVDLNAITTGGLAVSTAPSVAAGAAQTFTTRMALAPTGTLTLTPDAGVSSLDARARVDIQNPAGTESLRIFTGGAQKVGIGATGTLTLTPDAGQALVIPPWDFWASATLFAFRQSAANKLVFDGSSQQALFGMHPLPAVSNATTSVSRASPGGGLRHHRHHPTVLARRQGGHHPARPGAGDAGRAGDGGGHLRLRGPHPDGRTTTTSRTTRSRRRRCCSSASPRRPWRRRRATNTGS